MTVARLRSADGLLAEAFHFPLGRSKAFHDATVEARAVEDGGHWIVELQADRFAQSVHLDVPHYRAADDWFHLAPGAVRRVALFATTAVAEPRGEVVFAGGTRRTAF